MRGQPERLSGNYLIRKGGKSVQKTFRSTEVFCTPSSPFVRKAFVCFVLVWLFIHLPFLRFFTNREIKHEVRRQTAKMKLLPSVFSCLYSEVKIFVFAVNSRRRFPIFV